MQNKRAERTCRKCSLAYQSEDGKIHCEIDEAPARNPRARALKCRSFLHFKECPLFRAFQHYAANQKEITQP